MARSIPASEFNDNSINEISLGAIEFICPLCGAKFWRAKSYPLALRVATSSPSVVDRGRWFYPL